MAKRDDFLWHGYLRPPLRDPILWFAIAFAALAFVPQLVLLGVDPSSPGWWFRVVVQAALTGFVIIAIVGTGAGITRGWEQGLREGRQKRRR